MTTSKTGVKPAKTIEEQLEILKSRNLIVDDDDFAIDALQKVSYYRFRAYWISLQDKNTDEFKPGTTFRQIYSLYEFDRKLRKIIGGLLELIEISFRTRIAYNTSHLHGPLFYLDDVYFADNDVHRKFVVILQKAIQNARKAREPFVLHHDEKYDSQLPIWVAVELMTFKMLSYFFSNLSSSDKRYIASTAYGIPPIYIQSWIQSLAHIRNVCAHYGRLYNKSITSHSVTLFKADGRDVKNGSLFSAIFVAGIMCPNSEEWSFIVTELQALFSQYEEYVELHRLGFPENWTELLTTRVNKRKFDAEANRLKAVHRLR